MKRILAILLAAVAVVQADTTFYDTVTWDFGSSLIVNSGITARFLPGSTVDATGATLVGFPGGTGASSFIGLTDAPHSYSGQAGNYVVVNPSATGLIFVAPPSGGGTGGTVTNFTAGNLSPLFNTTVTTPSTTPNLSFSLLNVGAGLFWGNETGVTAPPHYVQPGFANLSGDFALTQTPSLAAGSLIGRGSASAGDWQPITVGTGLSLVGTTLSSAAGNVSNSGTPTVDQLPVWVDATHIKGVRGLTGGNVGQVLKKLSSTDYDWSWAADLAGGGGGAAVFTDLGDVPSSYFGAASRIVAVNSSATGLEFVPAPAASAVTSVFGRTGAVTALVGDYSTFYQPLDTDLTSIASLTTTAFGRGFLTLADAVSSRSYIGAGTSNFDGTWTSLTGKPTTLVGFGITDAQPLDSDLTSLAGLTGTNNIYYRSGAGTWSSVTFGSNMTWGSGALNASNTNWDTAFTDRMKWDGGATGLVAATGRTSLGLVVGTNVQAWDADLDSLAAASGTNTIYYRSAANTWSAVTIGSGLTFSGGTMTAAGAGDLSSNTSLSVDGEIVLFSGVSGKLVKRAVGSGIVTITSGVMGTITDNSANWNTAAAQIRQWDGGATGLNATTGKSSLGLSLVTNDVQTQAAVVPNTAPTIGQILVGNGTSYVPRTVSGGSGTTVSFSSTGVLTINGIANGNLANNSIQIGNTPTTTVLGGTATADQIIGATGLGYVKRTGTSAYTATTTSIPNGDLANSAITIATNSTALGGTVTQDAITGLSGVGLVKHTGANAMALAVAGTDYKVGTQNTINVRIVTTTSTYTPSTGVTSLYVEGVGGGGGGGGCHAPNAGNSSAAMGGAGGGYAAVYIGTPLASYSVTVGAGGAAGTGSVSAGNGGNTSFGSVLTATGGAGGQSNLGTGINGALAWASGATGGVGTVGSFLSGGSDGGVGLSLSGSTSMGGNGGSSTFGGGAKGGVTTTATQASVGSNGNTFGGGGGGSAVTASAAASNGGTGGAGVIRVWEIF